MFVSYLAIFFPQGSMLHSCLDLAQPILQKPRLHRNRIGESCCSFLSLVIASGFAVFGFALCAYGEISRKTTVHEESAPTILNTIPQYHRAYSANNLWSPLLSKTFLQQTWESPHASSTLERIHKPRLQIATSATSGTGLEALLSGSDVRSNAFTADQAFKIGQAFAQWLTQVKVVPTPVRIAVGQDPRNNGNTLVEALSAGIQANGAETARLGLATTPAAFASTFMGDLPYSAAVMVTASHLPPEWNGMKFFTSSGGLSKEDVRGMLSLCSDDEFIASRTTPEDPMFVASYKESLVARMREAGGGLENPLEGLHIVLNAGNGAGGMMVEVLQALGADTSGSVNLEPDGNFPVHTPNPENEEMVKATTEAVRLAGADIGIMFDTDVDRSGLIDGRTLEPLNKNRLIAAAARMVLRDHPGATIVTDSVTSVGLTDFIEQDGGRHLRFKRGYKNVIDKAIDLCSKGIEAPLAIETSGHGALRDNRWMDDGAFLALRLVTLFGTLRRQASEGDYSLMSLISGLREPQESVEFRLRVLSKDAETKSLATRSIRELIESEVRNRRAWSLEEPNYEGIRVRIDESDGQTGWFLFRESLHEPLVVVNAESDTRGGTASLFEALLAGGLQDLEGTLDLSLIQRYLNRD